MKAALRVCFPQPSSASPSWLCGGWEAEGHCRVWGKDHTPGKGVSWGGGRGAGEQRAGRLPEARLEGYGAESIPPTSSGRNEGKKEEGKKGRAGKEGKKKKENVKQKKHKNNVCLP